MSNTHLTGTWLRTQHDSRARSLFRILLKWALAATLAWRSKTCWMERHATGRRMKGGTRTTGSAPTTPDTTTETARLIHQGRTPLPGLFSRQRWLVLLWPVNTADSCRRRACAEQEGVFLEIVMWCADVNYRGGTTCMSNGIACVARDTILLSPCPPLRWTREGYAASGWQQVCRKRLRLALPPSPMMWSVLL